jgi:SWI/SNF-related matrix-associated actin-dependent regulator 1 of chromatin subfamily A
VGEKLFPYQLVGSEWLCTRKVALLADEMGLGKSAQAIHAADEIGAGRILVLCPAVARVNWLREFEKFSYYKRSFVVVTDGKLTWKDSDSLICSYDLAVRSSDRLKNDSFDLLILDESHFLKSTDAKRTKAVFGKEGLVRRAGRVWALSGTPMPNHPGELWPILYTFGRTPLPYEKFVEKFCTYIPSAHGMQITGTRQAGVEELKQLIAPVTLRRRKEEVMKELPPIHFTDITVEAGPVDIDIQSSFVQYARNAQTRQELEDKLASERKLMEGIVDRTGFGRDGMKMLEAMAQSVSTLRRYTGLQKVEKTAELIAGELASGAMDKVVIFAIHRDVIEELRVRLSKFKPVTLYGGTDPERRQRNVDKFMKNPKCRVFIGNILAAGTAITLTSAHNVVFIEQDWVPGNNAQAAMRCHRIGQLKPVLVRFVGLADSIDERVAQVLKRKTREIAQIFDDERLQSSQRDATAETHQMTEGDI